MFDHSSVGRNNFLPRSAYFVIFVLENFPFHCPCKIPSALLLRNISFQSFQLERKIVPDPEFEATFPVIVSQLIVISNRCVFLTNKIKQKNPPTLSPFLRFLGSEETNVHSPKKKQRKRGEKRITERKSKKEKKRERKGGGGRGAGFAGKAINTHGCTS